VARCSSSITDPFITVPNYTLPQYRRRGGDDRRCSVRSSVRSSGSRA